MEEFSIWKISRKIPRMFLMKLHRLANWILIFVGTSAFGVEETAYTALRVIGKAQGKEVLSRVISLQGRNGAPQPAVWKITLDEPKARGGIREVEVQYGKIISERTPTAPRTSTGKMNFSQLNLDSDGAFTVANQAATKVATPFDRVDYLLTSGTNGGAPVWHLQLTEIKTGPAGTLEISADTAAILQQDLKPRASVPPPGVVAGNKRRSAPPVSGADTEHSQVGEPFRDVPDFFHRLGKRFERQGKEVQQFFKEHGTKKTPPPNSN